jgi:hypothetical protein
MTFSAKQLRALRRQPDQRHIRTRFANGRELSYLEGWYAISEANRIFGFDGWSRETVESRCVLARENKGTFLAVYIARVRLTVEAEGSSIIREGHGSGEGRGISPGEVHDIALKAAETDATKRALATFGKPFGLELYRKDRTATPARAPQVAVSDSSSASAGPGEALRTGFHPDGTIPVPRPSTYYGRHNYLAARERAQVKAKGNARKHVRSASSARPQGSTIQKVSGGQTDAAAVPLVPSTTPDLSPGRIDKSALTIAEPKRLRDKDHLKFVASQPCLVCGRQPSDPHHLRFAQPRALGMKVSDEFAVPLCRGHHRQLHQAGDEAAWWKDREIKPLEIAKDLWEESHRQTKSNPAIQPNIEPDQIDDQTPMTPVPSNNK